MKIQISFRWFCLTLLVTFFALLFVAPTVIADIVTGVVVDCHGNPVDGAAVALFKVEGTNETRLGIQTTNGHGVFEFQASKGTYNVLVSCPGAASTHSVNFSIPGTAAGALRLVCDCPKTNTKSTMTTAGGLTKVTFDTLSGRVIVNLPDDMRAGDTISGTVSAEPNGNTPDERKASAPKVSEVNLIFGSKAPKDKKELVVLMTPRVIVQDESSPGSSNLNQADFNINLPETFDYTIGVNAPRADTGTVTIKIGSPVWFINNTPTTPSTQPPASGNDFRLPELGQPGRPIEIIGPFDGNSQNTKLNWVKVRSAVQDFEKNTENVSGGFGLLAESPRKAVFEAPKNVTGPIEITLKEGAKETKGTCRNVGVDLSAPKTNLLRGEHTTLKIQVTGLEGLKAPVRLTLESHGVITMEGGMFQPIVIQPSQVGADGRYTTTRGVTGVQTGVWSSTATVVTQPFNIVLRDPDPPQTILINSFTGDYAFCGPGHKLTGTGQIKWRGCVITLTDDRPDRQVQGRLDGCVPAVSANTDLKVSVQDPKTNKVKVYFNYPGPPAPAVTDTSAFATCP